jgi:predicted RNA-binding protein (virulence factor B family)
MKNDKDYELPAPGALKARQPVELEILAQTDLGYKALVDDRYVGLIYRSEIPGPLKIGQYLKGWIKAVRPDGKIDLSITQLDADSRDELEEAILRYLHRKGGSAPISDKSSPEEILKLFGTSKANFKRAIGRLYKSRQIVIEDAKIRIA